MKSVSTVKENPNKFSATYEVEGDLLGKFSKVSISRGSALEKYSPLAQAIFSEAKNVLRIDFSSDGNKTYISLARKLMPWTPENVETGRAATQNFFNKGGIALLAEAMAQDIAGVKPFDPAGHPIKKLVVDTFQRQVNPLIAKDGGAMELVNVELDNSGSIFADVLLVGSCNGCGTAEGATLAYAKEQISQVLELTKQRYAANPAVQSLKFEGIRIKPGQSDLVFTKP